MNEIIQRLIDKTGLSEDKATMAVDTVLNFLKEKLPAPVAGQIDSLMAGGGTHASGQLSELAGSVAGMFGKKE